MLGEENKNPGIARGSVNRQEDYFENYFGEIIMELFYNTPARDYQE